MGDGEGGMATTRPWGKNIALPNSMEASTKKGASFRKRLFRGLRTWAANSKLTQVSILFVTREALVRSHTTSAN